jgi:hypothetical protein
MVNGPLPAGKKILSRGILAKSAGIIVDALRLLATIGRRKATPARNGGCSFQNTP